MFGAISFHSLEHRLVKQFFEAHSGRELQRVQQRAQVELLTRNPLLDKTSCDELIARMIADSPDTAHLLREPTLARSKLVKPSEAEIDANRRAASAQFRYSVKL